MHKTTQERIDFLVKILYAAVVILLCYIGLRIAGLIWPFLLALVLVACINPLVRLIHRKLKINIKLVSVIFWSCSMQVSVLCSFLSVPE